MVPSERVVEVKRPCAAKAPTRPLVPPLTGNAVHDIVILGKLVFETYGPGKYADKAESAIRLCSSGD